MYIKARIPQIRLTICNKNLEHMLNKTCHHSDFDKHLIHTCRQPVNTVTIFSVKFFIQLSECRYMWFSPSLSSSPAIFSLPI